MSIALTDLAALRASGLVPAFATIVGRASDAAWNRDPIAGASDWQPDTNLETTER